MTLTKTNGSKDELNLF